MALETWEKTLLACVPIRRIVATAMARITANNTAYSAMSSPRSSRHNQREGQGMAGYGNRVSITADLSA